jgi:hypothetical protein
MAGLPILMYDEPNYRFIKATEASNPGISARTNEVMRLIRAGDSCKDANTDMPGGGLYANQQELINIIYRLYGFANPPLGITSIGTGQAVAKQIEDNIIHQYLATEEDYTQQVVFMQNYFWDCGTKPKTPGSLMIRNTATELDPHEEGTGGSVPVDTNLNINNDELYLIGLSNALGGTDGITLRELGFGRYNFTEYQIFNINLLTYSTSPPINRNIHYLFESSANSTKNNYIGYHIRQPFNPPILNDIPLDGGAAGLAALIVKFLTKEMGDTFQAISVNKCIFSYPGIDPLKTFLYTFDKGTFVSCIQQSVPSLGKFNDVCYIYRGYIIINQADVQLIADNYIDIALNLINYGITYVLDLIDNNLSTNITNLVIDGVVFPMNELRDDNPVNRQECINFYRLGMYRLLYYHKLIKDSIIRNRHYINQLITGIGILDNFPPQYQTAHPGATPAEIEAITNACNNDKFVLANYIKDYYLNQVIANCYTCQQIGGRSNTLANSYKLLNITYANALNFLQRPVIDLTPNLTGLTLTGIPDLAGIIAGINGLWNTPFINDNYQYCFFKLCDTYNNLSKHKSLLLTRQSCSINRNKAPPMIDCIHDYMDEIGNGLYPIIVDRLRDEGGYTCIPFDSAEHLASVRTNIIGGHLKKLIKNKIKKTIKGKIKKLIKNKIKKTIKKRGGSGSGETRRAAFKGRNFINKSITRRKEENAKGRKENRRRVFQAQRIPFKVLEFDPRAFLDKPAIINQSTIDVIGVIFNNPAIVRHPTFIAIIQNYSRVNNNVYSYVYHNIIRLIMCKNIFLPNINSSYYLCQYIPIITADGLGRISQILGFATVIPPPSEVQYTGIYSIVICYINNSYDNLYLIHEDVCSLYLLLHFQVGHIVNLLNKIETDIANYYTGLIKYKHLYILNLLSFILTFLPEVVPEVVIIDTTRIQTLFEVNSIINLFICCMQSHKNCMLLDNRENRIIMDCLIHIIYIKNYPDPEPPNHTPNPEQIYRYIENVLNHFINLNLENFQSVCRILMRTVQLNAEKITIIGNILVKAMTISVNVQSFINIATSLCIALTTPGINIEEFRQLGLNNDPAYHIALYAQIIARFPPAAPQPAAAPENNNGL